MRQHAGPAAAAEPRNSLRAKSTMKGTMRTAEAATKGRAGKTMWGGWARPGRLGADMAMRNLASAGTALRTSVQDCTVS